jgi:hypothetical protein
VGNRQETPSPQNWNGNSGAGDRVAWANEVANARRVEPRRSEEEEIGKKIANSPCLSGCGVFPDWHNSHRWIKKNTFFPDFRCDLLNILITSIPRTPI